VIVDVGAGDGGYVVHRARTEPASFAIAIDASPDALVDGAWKAKRARLRNAAFLVEAIERLPHDLDRVADEVTVHFPWGSLLRGLLAADPSVLRPLASLLKPGGELRVLLSATARDGYDDVTPADVAGAVDAYAASGLRLTAARAAMREDIAAARSTWAKRLGDRPAVHATFTRGDGASSERENLDSDRRDPA
jgi:16S rRNA (adenine(1408)-N(1))-methyltransferase